MFGFFKNKNEDEVDAPAPDTASSTPDTADPVQEPAPTEPEPTETETAMSAKSKSSISTRLAELGYVLPPVAAPVAAYVPAVTMTDARGRTTGIQTSGQLPISDGQLAATGKVGEAAGLVSPSVAYQLAKMAALNALAAAADCAGDVDNLDSIAKVTVFVASDVSFTGQAQVANGASEFFGEIFEGGHSRSAVGVAVLPLDAPVEVEVLFNVR